MVDIETIIVTVPVGVERVTEDLANDVLRDAIGRLHPVADFNVIEWGDKIWKTPQGVRFCEVLLESTSAMLLQVREEAKLRAAGDFPLSTSARETEAVREVLRLLRSCSRILEAGRPADAAFLRTSAEIVEREFLGETAPR